MTPALLRLPIARLTRTPRAWVSMAGWSLLVIVCAVYARSRPGHHAVDNVLLGIYGDIALPLLAFGVVSAVLAGRDLATAGAPLVRFGAPPWRAALAHALVAVAASALVGATLAVAVVALAHDGESSPLAFDLAASAYAGLVGGAAYGALFALGSAFGPRGLGRGVVLVLDWVLGSSTGAGALVMPRAHVRSLLGDPSRLDITPRGSALTLVVLSALFTGLAVLSVSRRRR